MFSAVYAVLASLLICALIALVVKARRKEQIAYGDGGNENLMIARSAHANAVETIPICLILLMCLEYNGASLYLVNVLGICLISARVMHAVGIIKGKFKGRVIGMQLTLATIIALVIGNIYYLPMAKLGF